MRSTTFAAASFISMASFAMAVPLCAINCFQKVITDHPPLDCTEPDMYHCFCKIASLQTYYKECAYLDGLCANDQEAGEAVGFGVDLCTQLQLPILIGTEPPTRPTTAPPPAETTPPPPAETTPPAETSAPPPAESSAPPAESSEAPEPSASAAPSVSAPGSASASASGTRSASPSASGSASPSAPVTVNMANGLSFAPLVAAAGVAVAAYRLF